MSKRQLINDLDKELQENTINEIKELFGEEFLTKGRDLQKHQLKILWNRVDYLSTVELYLIGNAIKHNKHNIEWIKDLKKKVTKNKEGSIRGFIYELFISSVISDSILAEPSQEGYDLKIKNSGLLDINLSIKKMVLSDKEKEYKNYFHELEVKFKKILQTNKLNGVTLIIKTDKFDFQKTQEVIKKAITNFQTYSYFQGMIDDMFVYISDMFLDYELYTKKLSYQFNLIIPFDNIEEKRFIKKVRESVKNINQLNIKKNELNSIIIGLSPSQSIYEAKMILEKEIHKGIFKSEDDSMFVPLENIHNIDNEDKYSNILFIILAKHVPAIDKKNDTTHIRHEFAIVFNTKNLLKYKDQFKKFVFSIELGSVNMIEKENDESYLNIGDNLKISNCYSFQSIYKHQFIRETQINTRYNFLKNGQHKENTISFFKDGKYITTISPFNYGEYNNLLIL